MKSKSLLDVKELNIEVRGERLIDNLSFSLQPGDKLGLIGQEGNGKSILMKTIGQQELGDGVVAKGQINRNGSIGLVPQELSADELMMVPSEFLCDGEWNKLNNIHLWHLVFQQLGMKNEWLDKDLKMSEISGGERVRLKLARVLFDRPEILLLDEPTNYLDIETLSWLEGICRDFAGGLMVVSHDEVFLENIVNRILHLERLSKRQKNIWHLANLGFADYQQQRADRFESDLKESARQKRKHDEQIRRLKKIKHKVMMDQIRIIDSSARRLLNKKMKTLVGQQEKLARKDLLPKPEREIGIDFQWEERDANPQKIWLDWRDKNVLLPSKKIFVSQFSVIGREKVFIVGPNGTGKTQLLKVICDLMVSQDVKIGYCPQDFGEIIDNGVKVIDWLAQWAQSQVIRTWLGAMNFNRKEMNSCFGQLSSGQKMKVIWLMLKLQRPKMLILDEPTSNLSLFSRQELRRAVKEFYGPVITVTHDRKFIEEAADRVYQIDGDKMVEINSWKNIDKSL